MRHVLFHLAVPLRRVKCEATSLNLDDRVLVLLHDALFCSKYTILGNRVALLRDARRGMLSRKFAPISAAERQTFRIYGLPRLLILLCSSAWLRLLCLRVHHSSQ